VVVVCSLGILGNPQGVGKVVRDTEQRAVVLTRTAWGKEAAERPVPCVTTARTARFGEAASEQPAALAELPASETTPYDELEQVIDDTAEYTLMMPCRNPSVSPRSD
jgi:hypothetical protein